MATARTWLLVAAEQREFDGILKRFGGSKPWNWPARFAAQAEFDGDRWLLIANGPGAALVDQALSQPTRDHGIQVNGIISTGFCGALDPALRVGDIVRELHSIDRVAVTAAEKHDLRLRTGAAAVDMESAAIARKAADWRIPFHIIRAVSDTAEEDMPLDFNAYRARDGRFSRTRIALAALARPVTRVPALLRLDRNCQIAAESLGDYFAHCRL
jgi:adenosylhomocysteine nucleosidase